MTSGQWVLVVSLVLAVGFGLWRLRTDGHFRRATATPSVADRLRAAGVEVTLGERATLLQFSSAFCAPCRTTRVLLADVAGAEPGVVHVEVDAEQHLDLVRDLGILRTPTTLVLDAEGHERARAAGAPRRDQVLAALMSGQ